MAPIRSQDGFGVFAARTLAAALLLSPAACKHSEQPPIAAAAVAPAETKKVAPPGPPPAGAQNAQKRIAILRLLVDRDPGDVKAWIALGNEYFDSGERAKAVDAYAKALQLQPDNPDVLTDQGVMYRELGAVDKAIANFEKASTIKPNHVQSILDLGVLYAQDLKDFDKALKSWDRVVAIAPVSPQAARAREYIEEIKRTPTPR
jgi:cytochrome c-type biogenesis protein CcmH/NrfG